MKYGRSSGRVVIKMPRQELRGPTKRPRVRPALHHAGGGWSSYAGGSTPNKYRTK